MKELAESKPLYKVTLRNGREIITSINSDLIEKAVMTAKMIKLT
jgi:predicted DNA-binding antitoxin AbrB/MazE fold protein